MKQLLSLQNLRRVYGVFFLGLFLLCLGLTSYGALKGYRVEMFLELSPLVSLGAFLTSGTLYLGLALSLGVIILTLLGGRIFCSWICPLGILNQTLGWILNRRRAKDDLSLNAHHPRSRTKYLLLVLLLAMALGGSLQVGLLDPLALLSRSLIFGLFPWLEGGPGDQSQRLYQGGFLVGAILLGLFWMVRLLPRYWCRSLCPLGALLGLLARFSLFRIRRDLSTCDGCNQCQRHCQGACDPQGELRVSECLACMNCISDCPKGSLSYGLPQPQSSPHQGLDLNRRRLVEGFLVGLALAPLFKTNLVGQSLPNPDLIRPPGSLSEPDFLKRCIKCGMCMKVCPTNVLQPAWLEGGLEGLWTPVLNLEQGYCEQTCVACSQVCPTAAILPLQLQDRLGSQEQKPLSIGTAFFDQGRCLPWAMQTPCIVCEEVCPTSPKAIWFEEREVMNREGKGVKLKLPFVEPKLCIGCGICQNKCPVTDRAAIRVSSVGETRSRQNGMLL